MYDTLRAFPQQFSSSILRLQTNSVLFDVDLKLSPKINPMISRIFYVAMGGSSLAADLMQNYLGPRLPIHLVRDYEIRDTLTQNDLVIAASFSGNTEETLSALQDALNSPAQIIAMSHGGQLKKIAQEKKIPFLEIPACIQPRCATGYFFYNLAFILKHYGYFDNLKIFENLSSFLEKNIDSCEEIGSNLAKQMKDMTPLVYGPDNFKAICRTWKIKLNENSKIPAFSNTFPEFNHNEMVSFSKMLFEPVIILLKSQFMSERINKRMDIFEDMVSNKYKLLKLKLKGSDLLQETFYTLLIGDFCSYFLAQHYGIDPTPVEIIENFKKALI